MLIHSEEKFWQLGGSIIVAQVVYSGLSDGRVQTINVESIEKNEKSLLVSSLL